MQAAQAEQAAAMQAAQAAQVTKQTEQAAAMQAAQAAQMTKMMDQMAGIASKNKSREHDSGDDKSKLSKYGPMKLRLEGQPRWPPLNRQANTPFYIWAEDFLVWAGLLGYPN